MGSLGLLLSPPPCQGRLSASGGSTSVPEVCEFAPVWPLTATQREVGPLSSRLPRRHLTGHGGSLVRPGEPAAFSGICLLRA